MKGIIIFFLIIGIICFCVVVTSEFKKGPNESSDNVIIDEEQSDLILNPVSSNNNYMQYNLDDPYITEESKSNEIKSDEMISPEDDPLSGERLKLSPKKSVVKN